jgi:hypothetical protein
MEITPVSEWQEIHRRLDTGEGVELHVLSSTQDLKI